MTDSYAIDAETEAANRGWWRRDAVAVSVLAVAVGLSWIRLVAGGTIIGQDSATQFYPWYSYLGERLRQLDIPLWSSAQFSGAPFVADPQSGWTYVLAMALFATLPLALAANAYLLAHLALAAFGAYGLARALGIGSLGALTAGLGYGLSGLVYGRSVCCPAQIQAAAWMPLLLFGADIAIRQRTLAARAAWWGITGFALSQILATWLGQVSYYALLVLGSFVAYRTLLDPPIAIPRWKPRLLTLIYNGSAILAVGFGLAAAGILPRLDYNRWTNVAGGVYGGPHEYAAILGGWSPEQTPLGDLTRSLYYPGGGIAALALIGVILARRKYASPYFAGVIVAAFILAFDRTTPLHWLLYNTLPRFEDLHRHWPERIAIATFIAPSMLAGATVSAIASYRIPARRLLAAALVPTAVIVGAATIWHLDVSASWIGVGAALLVAGVVAVRGLLKSPLLVRAIPVILLGIASVDLAIAGPKILDSGPYGGFHRVDLDAYYAPSGAVQFLQEQLREEPFRFFGYDPALRATVSGLPVLYRYQFVNPRSAALIVNNRATIFGLEDVQGYNPVQFQRYVDYITALNGARQEYHDAAVFPAGLSSPLVDLLNVRYIVLPAEFGEDRDDIQELLDQFPVVYRDESVQIVENTDALPRAWIVHDVRQHTAEEALEMLASGVIDPRVTALLEETPPETQQPASPDNDRVTIVERRPERMVIQVTTDAPGLLVLSEVATPGWQATVDGEPSTILSANYLFRSVPIPAGTHVVEIRYESNLTTLGLVVSAATVFGIVALALSPLWFPSVTSSRIRRRVSPALPT